MKKQTGWLWVAALLAGMASCGKKIPDDIIQPDAMESLLYDYHLGLYHEQFAVVYGKL